MGSDLDVVNAARVSFGQKSTYESHLVSEFYGENDYVEREWESRLKEKDRKLIEYLARGMTTSEWDDFLTELRMDFYKDHDEEVVDLLWKWRNTPTHETPFGHCYAKFHVKAPIFVRSQLVKHEFLRMSEISRRYVTSDPEFYMPDVWRGKPEKGKSKQGSSGEVTKMGSPLADMSVRDFVEVVSEMSLHNYQELLASGVAPEQARMVLPQSMYTEWIWSGSLDAFCQMCRLRLGCDAQEETRQIARQVYDKLLELFPVSAEALVEGVK